MFGIPIHETPECRRRRKAQKYAYKVDKQDAHTDRTDIRNAQQAAGQIAKAQAGLTPGADTAAAFAGAIPGLASAIVAGINPVAGLFGGLDGGSSTTDLAEPLPGPDLAPLAIGAAVVGIAILIWSR